MGGRGGSSGIRGLKMSTDFNEFVRENMSNPKFKEFGRKNGMEAVREVWRDERIKQEKANAHEMSRDEAIETLRENIPDQTMAGWFREADSSAKPKLVETVMSEEGTLNAAWNLAYQNYLSDKPENPMGFKKWLNTPQTMYRGEYGQDYVKSDIFTSFTSDRSVAEGFAKGSNATIKSVRIKPIDTLGNYNTMAEKEFPVLNRRN